MNSADGSRVSRRIRRGNAAQVWKVMDDSIEEGISMFRRTEEATAAIRSEEAQFARFLCGDMSIVKDRCARIRYL